MSAAFSDINPISKSNGRTRSALPTEEVMQKNLERLSDLKKCSDTLSYPHFCYILLYFWFLKILQIFRIYYYLAELQAFLLLQDTTKVHTDLVTFSQNHFTDLHLLVPALHQVA